ncbi:MAG: CBS domain-containing protein [Candidatus Nitrosocaldus sp.]|nr:CBS domain-containing protein [Candidatus Nitrosocaldus sp.]MDW8274873.1 CBS domain-containing protein [Candidatus Nitrosocaldus sp.]
MVVRRDRESTDPHVTTRILVRDVMNSPVITAGPDSTVNEIAETMSKMKIGSIVITDNGQADGEPVGMVTDWDIVSKASVRDERPSRIKAKDIMQQLVIIESEASVTEAARLLRKHNVKRLGVVYKGKLVGVVSSSDVIAVMPELVDVISEKASMMRGELGRSPTLISGYCDECEEWSDYLVYVDGKFLCEECRAGE